MSRHLSIGLWDFLKRRKEGELEKREELGEICLYVMSTEISLNRVTVK